MRTDNERGLKGEIIKLSRVRKAGILGLAAMLALQFTGCGKTDEVQETAGTQDKDYIYAADYQDLEADGYTTGSMIFGEDEKVYFAGSSEEGIKQLFSMDIGAGESTASPVPVELEADAYISAIGTDSEGNLLLGIVKYADTAVNIAADNVNAAEDDNVSAEDAGSGIGGVEIRKISLDGQTLESVDVMNVLGKVKDLYIQNVLADKDGNYYVNANQSVYVLKPSGEMLCELQAGTYIQSLFRMKDGTVVVGFYGDTGWRLQSVDLSGKALKDLNSSISFGYGTYQAGVDADILYTQDTKLYTCNLSDTEPTEVLDWLESDINSTSLQSVKLLKDGRIAALSMDFMSEQSKPELIVLTKKDRSEVSGKTTLTYGTVIVPYYLSNDIAAFNKQSDKYRIEVKQYGDDSMDDDARVALLAADLAGGKGPDLIDMVFNFTSLDKFISMGALEDLTPYLENDAVIKREDYFENVLNTYARDGKLYAIIPCFGISTIVGKVSDVGDKKSWTMDDTINLMDSKPEDTQILDYNTKNSILQLLCSMNMGEFVDAETGTCDFTGGEFKRILEFSNQFPKEVSNDSDSGFVDRIRNGQLILMQGNITSVQQFQMYEYIFKEEINFIGYPTIGESGSVIRSNGTTAGMNVNSKNKEGAWEFLKFNLTKDRQENLQLANGGFPTMKEALEKQFAKDVEAEYYEDTDGTQKEKSKSTWTYGSGTDNITMDVYSATQEQVARVREIIEQSVGLDGTESEEMLSIISEEAQSYFEGQKSADDVAALVQNRLQTYINETR